MSRLHDVLQVGVLGQVELLSSVKRAHLWHHLLQEGQSCLVIFGLGVEGNDKSTGIGSAQGVIESITAVFFVEGNYGNAGLDAAHLGYETFCGVGLVSVEDKFVTWGETGLKKTESEG